jgi:glycosyltransferase involved in cell wall biosynthesis
MIYVCVPVYNEAQTVGLLLWKVRRVFRDFEREYHLLVVDDASDDATPDILSSYARVLPLTLVRHDRRVGYAATVEELLREALRRTDRPRRDSAIALHADFGHDPASLPELVRGIESGADVVVAEHRQSEEQRPLAERLLRQMVTWYLGGAVGIEGVRDVTSGFCAFRLSALQPAFRRPAPALTLEGYAASAELLRRVRPHARRVEAVAVSGRGRPLRRPRRRGSLGRLTDLVRARSVVRNIAA